MTYRDLLYDVAAITLNCRSASIFRRTSVVVNGGQ